MNNNPGYKKLWEKPFLIEQTYKWLLWGYETEFVGKRTKECFYLAILLLFNPVWCKKFYNNLLQTR